MQGTGGDWIQAQVELWLGKGRGGGSGQLARKNACLPELIAAIPHATNYSTMRACIKNLTAAVPGRVTRISSLLACTWSFLQPAVRGQFAGEMEGWDTGGTSEGRWCSSSAQTSKPLSAHSSGCPRGGETSSPAELEASPAQLVVAALRHGVALCQVRRVRRHLVSNHSLQRVAAQHPAPVASAAHWQFVRESRRSKTVVLLGAIPRLSTISRPTCLTSSRSGRPRCSRGVT